MDGLSTTRDPQHQWRRFGAGDRMAFAALYDTHRDDVHRYCRSLLHDDEDASDAAQSTWTAIWTTPAAARRGIPLRPWLFRVAHNQSVDILRRRRAHDQLDALELAAADDVEGDVELRDRLATLHADLVALPERQRSTLLLHEMCGLSHHEIGAVFAISATAAKQSVYEARQALIDAEGGRSMACALAEKALSDGDGRVRRGRRLRAHLRSCASCRAFADGVAHDEGTRRRLLAPLCLPAAIRMLIGSSGRGWLRAGSGGALSSGAGLGGALMAKGAAVAVLVAVTAGAGHEVATAHHTHPPRASAVAAAAPSPAPARAGTGRPGARPLSGGAASATKTINNAVAAPSSSSTSSAPGRNTRTARPAAATSEPSTGPAADATSGQAATAAATAAPGHSANAPGHATTTAPGNSANAPGHATTNTTATAPGNSANAPGHATTDTTSTSPGNSANAPGHATTDTTTAAPGSSANAPGHATTDTTTAAPGNSANAPGHATTDTTTAAPGKSADAPGHAAPAAPPAAATPPSAQDAGPTARGGGNGHGGAAAAPSS